ncbi:MAG: hypothetical protein ABJL35_03660 [Parasphingorhabdus sp.]|uniref:hypothetical protein n=1 Tax=Parasphingorhabdus sp. TaxID=2709688 RepID=UPI003296FD79
MYIIEYQARGIVHAHITVKYEGATTEQRAEADDWIWTNLPDPSIANGELRARVLKYMVHKKFGSHNISAPGMKASKTTTQTFCHTNYPQPLRSSLHTNKSGRAKYKRLKNGDKAAIQCKNGEI